MSLIRPIPINTDGLFRRATEAMNGSSSSALLTIHLTALSELPLNWCFKCHDRGNCWNSMLRNSERPSMTTWIKISYCSQCYISTDLTQICLQIKVIRTINMSSLHTIALPRPPFPHRRLIIKMHDLSVGAMLSRPPNRSKRMIQGTLSWTFDQTVQPQDSKTVSRAPRLFEADDWLVCSCSFGWGQALWVPSTSGMPCQRLGWTYDCRLLTQLVIDQDSAICPRLTAKRQSIAWREPGLGACTNKQNTLQGKRVNLRVKDALHHKPVRTRSR